MSKFPKTNIFFIIKRKNLNLLPRFFYQIEQKKPKMSEFQKQMFLIITKKKLNAKKIIF